MGKVLGLCLALAACHPLYEGRPERLPRGGEPRRHADPPVPEQEPPTYIDACAVQFHESPDAPRPPPPADRETSEAAAAADRVHVNDTTRRTIVEPTLERVLHLRAILRADPYDARATLDLALAYDRVWRKGCALALLHRLDELAHHPQFAAGAQFEVDKVVASPSLFHAYRVAALSALGQ
jgi:hypothetical protein